MKLKEALEVLAWDPYIEDAKDNTIYDPHGDFGRLSDYDVMVAKYGDCEVDEIRAWHDCTLIVKLKETVDET